ncbi:MAG: hypothetical protein P1U86_01775 [Verrucomicrobiales bacterium]|nr:hypothetical protein [Verrucomicrobiales bacterium]
MNSDEARFILSSVRPEETDHSAPQVEEAMRVLAGDPELQEWFEKSKRFDRTISDRLAEVSPPADLRDSILTGMEASRTSSGSRRKALAWSLAAVLALGGFLSLFLAPRDIESQGESKPTVAEFERAMQEVITGMPGLDLLSSDPNVLLRQLRDRADVAVPSLATANELSGLRYLGCKVVNWQGHEVSLICMQRSNSGTDMPNLHLFTIPAEAIEGLDHDEIIAHLPESEHSSRKWSTAVWQSEGRVYLVLAEGRHSNPRQLVPLG